MRPAELHPTVVPRVASLAAGVRFAERHRVGRPDILHRPFQVTSLHDLADRLEIGERFVLTHQDMIWDRTRAYHVGDARRDYRVATSAALSVADEVGFLSFHAAIDAASDGALALERATVVPLGVDHFVGRDVPETVARPLADRPFLLMVGSSFWHKNRVFSLRLLEWLVDEHGWEGGLVLVGGHHERTSSRRAEERFLAQAPSLSDRVIDLGHVPESEQLALYRDAELVLFPSLYEGFGFIPFEAAALGTASVYARRSAMDELLPASVRCHRSTSRRRAGSCRPPLQRRRSRERRRRDFRDRVRPHVGPDGGRIPRRVRAGAGASEAGRERHAARRSRGGAGTSAPSTDAPGCARLRAACRRRDEQSCAPGGPAVGPAVRLSRPGSEPASSAREARRGSSASSPPRASAPCT